VATRARFFGVVALQWSLISHSAAPLFLRGSNVLKLFFLNLRSSVKICGDYFFSDFGNLLLLAKLVVTE
jgi:hypothetical protein